MNVVNGLTFEDWKAECDAICMSRALTECDTWPDWNYWDCWNSESTPMETVEEMLSYNGWDSR